MNIGFEINIWTMFSMSTFWLASILVFGVSGNPNPGIRTKVEEEPLNMSGTERKMILKTIENRIFILFHLRWNKFNDLHFFNQNLLNFLNILTFKRKLF